MTKASRLYVIGDKATGVLMVLANPLKAIQIPLKEIELYASESGKSVEAVFGEIAAAAKKLILKSDDRSINNPAESKDVYDAIGAMIAGGTTISDAEFCFVADIDSKDWGTLRGNFVPLEPAVGVLSGGAEGKDGQVNNVELKGIEPSPNIKK